MIATLRRLYRWLTRCEIREARAREALATAARQFNALRASHAVALAMGAQETPSSVLLFSVAAGDRLSEWERVLVRKRGLLPQDFVIANEEAIAHWRGQLKELMAALTGGLEQ